MASSEQTEQMIMASLYRLTVYEHLWFFARLKNQPEDGLSEQIEQMILDLGIPHKRYGIWRLHFKFCYGCVASNTF